MPASIRLNIAEPCHEKWDQMTPDNEGRHCKSCQKTVIDFSTMTDKEILKYLGKSAQDVCGRFSDDQLNKEMPAGEIKKMPFWAYTWNLIVATCLLVVNANGQTKENIPLCVQKEMPGNTTPVLMGKISMPVQTNPGITRGILLDKETKLPVGYATVKVRQTGHSTIADSSGRFVLKQEQAGALSISAVGYEPKDLRMNDSFPGNIIYLERKAHLMEDLSVVCYRSACDRTYTGGAVSIVRTETIYAKVVREFKEYLPNKEVIVYPNPAMPGSTINIRMALKESGQFQLELFSNDGKLVFRQALTTTVKTSTINFPLNTFWSAGIYWIRISGGGMKRVYQGKLLVQ